MKNGNGKKIVKSFEKWSDYDVAEAFGLRFEETTLELQDWLSVTGSVPETLQNELENLRSDLFFSVNGWNEAELLSEFIHPFLHTVRFSDKKRKIKVYGDRLLTLPDEQYDAKGSVDWFVATGGYEPKKPFFFLHEYKRFKQGDVDPRGQVLMAMLAAQKHNADGFPVYGAWVAGSAWNFILLNGNVYSESDAYQAKNHEELTQIWLILNKTKQIIYDRVDKIIAAEKEANAQSPAV